jgi:hypothetical protein
VTASNSAVPFGDEAVTASNATVPSGHGAVTARNATVPVGHGAVTASNGAVPFGDEAVTASNATLPSGNAAVARAQMALFASDAAVGGPLGPFTPCVLSAARWAPAFCYVDVDNDRQALLLALPNVALCSANGENVPELQLRNGRFAESAGLTLTLVHQPDLGDVQVDAPRTVPATVRSKLLHAPPGPVNSFVLRELQGRVARQRR